MHADPPRPAVETHQTGDTTTTVQGVPKKMSFSGKTATTTFKLIQNAKVEVFLKGYFLPD